MVKARTLNEIAARLGAVVDGSGDVAITGLNGLADASDGELSFVASPKYLALARSTRAAALLVPEKFESVGKPMIRVKDPERAIDSLVDWFRPELTPLKRGVDPHASVAPTARLGPDVTVMAHATIAAGATIGDRSVIWPGVFVGENAVVGKDCTLHPNVVLRDRVRIGDRVVIHAGSVLGADGFGYRPGKNGAEKIEHVGTVVVDDDVEIGANVTIDRARFGRTWIGKGVKIDNLSQIAHNCRIGPHTLIAAQAGISGSTTIGAGGLFGGQVATSGHVTIGNRVTAAARSGISKDAPDGAILYGCMSAGDVHVRRREEAAVRKLPDLLARVRELEARIVELERRDRAP